MSERKGAVEEMIAAFNSDDEAALRRLLHPEVTVRRPLPDVGITSHPSDVGTYHGIDEVVPALGELRRAVGGLEVEIRRTEDVGPDGQLFEFLALIGPPEERTAQLGWALFRFAGGLIVSTETFATESAARATIAGGP